MPRPLLTLLALAFLAPLVTGSAGEPFAPSRVVAVSDGTSLTVVEWAPGAEPADSYRVYGLEGGAAVLLVDTADLAAPLVLAATVPGGYADYGVSGVSQDVESRLVFAGDLEGKCIRIQTDPPGVGIDNWCTRQAVMKVRAL